MMDKKENYLRTVRFERPEYIHMLFHINNSCWGHYPHDALQDLMEAHSFLFPDFVRKNEPIVIDHPPFVSSKAPWVDPWGNTWEISIDGILGAVTEHALGSWDQFESFSPPDPGKTTHWSPIDWQEAAESKNPIGFIDFMKCGEIGHGHTFLKLCDTRGYQNLLYDMMDGEPRLLELIGMLDEFNLGQVRNYLDIVGVEHMGYAEDLGMQVGPMLSPELFRKYIKPSYEKIIQPAKDAGCIIHMHSDGDIRLLMDDILDCGVDIINLQDLVNGIDWIAEKLAGKVCIDLDVDRQDIMMNGTPAQVDSLILEEIEKLGSKEGGLMLCQGVYPAISLENIEAAMDAMEKYAGYYS
ncbi:MAG: hypothetical protein HOC74_19595 [Gemmatimonadetes bacterium]|jgi:uroporphyrinogen decarboxylase|nr:hypothetical protein [Gemmatimonadota bacterium]